MITTMIADDDEITRLTLCKLLGDFPQVEVIGSCGDGLELLQLMQQCHPQSIFLDINMPGLDGVSLAARIRHSHPRTLIVFVTGHTRYAAEAFQLAVTDYLVKPVTHQDIARAMEKVDKYISASLTYENSNRDERLLFKNGRETFVLTRHDILFIEKDGRKAIIHSRKGVYYATEHLNKLEIRLSDTLFRCHRGYLINPNHIEKISPMADRIYTVSFSDYDKTATMTRTKLDELYQRLHLDF